MKHLRKLFYVMLAPVLIFTITVTSIQAQTPTPFPNCRLGIGGPYGPNLSGYNLAQLNMGRYLDWNIRANPESSVNLPAGIEYMQIVRVHQNKVGSVWHGGGPYVTPHSYSTYPNLTTIANTAASRPGSLWFIGNEMDRRDWDNGDGTWGGQDEMMPELYAKAFHEIRAVIKNADPTARVGIGSVIEATPLRLEYLDRVWNSYYAQYGYSMGKDIDAWNVHGFILREVRNSWGAEIPVGLDDAGGFLYGANMTAVREAHYNIEHFKQFTEALRSWMAAHGERNKPLINTEYGVLYKSLDGVSITTQQVNSYLTASFDYMLNKTDPNTGYPADGNKLVQGWVWYSLNDTFWNGSLFNPNTKALTSVGTTWKNYVSNASKPLASIPKPNLLALNLESAQVTAPPGGTATAILKAQIANSGNTTTATGNNLIIKFWDGPPGAPGSNLIASQPINDLPGCGRVTNVEVQWPGLGPGIHTWYVQAVPVANETQTGDNVAQGSVEVIQDSNANLSVTKSDSPDPVGVGKPLTYVTTVTNNGPDLATGVILTDTLSGSAATAGPAIPSQGSCTGTNPTTCQLGNLANGAQVTVTRIVTPTAAGTLANTAQVVGDLFDPHTPNNTRVETTIVTAPSLQFSASSYTVGENGGSATITVNRTAVDSGPVSVQYATSNGTASAGADYTATSGTLNWAAGDTSAKSFNIPILNDPTVEADETVLMTLSGAGGGATLGSPASATLVILNDDASSPNQANLAVVQTDSPDPVLVGNKLTYLITVTNHGPNPATGVKLTDILPGNITFGSATGASCTGTSTVTCNLGNLNSGANATVTIVVTPTQVGTLGNTASVTSNEIDPNSANNSSTIDTIVNERGTIKVQKYEDRNGNGQKDNGEPGLNGWSIILYNVQNQPITSGTTQKIGNENGWKWFEGLAPGSYKVCEVLPAQGNWVNSDPANGSLCKAVTLTNGSAVQTTQLGNYQPGTLTIVKNAAISYDFDFTGELGNFTLTSDSLNASRKFSGLVPGTYTVAEDPTSFPDNSWTLESITCKNSNNQSVSISVDLANYKADIPIQSGQQLTCTFDNHWGNPPEEENYGTYLPILVK